MTAIEVDKVARPEPQRDRWGRYVIPNDKGKPTSFTRATTISSSIEDRYNLERWKQRMTAYGLAQRSDLLALAATHNPSDDKRTFDEVIDKAMEAAQSGAAAAIGTALHRATEMVDGGTPLERIPEQFQEHCGRYTQALASAGVEIDPAGIERILVDDRYQIAGTGDRVPVTLPDGRRLVADLKTGAELRFSWLAISIQLAIYANHTATYDPAADRRGPRVDVDTSQALVIHLPANGDTCTLWLVDIAAGYDALLTALDVREHRKKPERLATRYQPTEAGTGGATAIGDWLRDRIRAIANTAGDQGIADLRNRWPASVPQPLPETPDDGQVDALAAVLSRVEKQHQIPFGPERPGTETPTKEQNT